MDNFNMSMMGGGGGNPQGGKKAVHVKWAGKTIALGTFPHQEAEEKCARAKALTRAWRSTMRPKPTREWVMLELERLGVRVVSGRLKSGGESGGAGVGDDDSADSVGGGGGDTKGVNNNNMSGMAAMGMGNNMGMMGNNMPNLGSDPSPGSSNHRPLVGGGSAAAYEAARADHYGKLDNKQGGAAQGGNIGGNINNNMPSMPNNNNNNNMPAPMPSFGLSVNPNQHYEMLKLHHMNLLNEIQETTLMMNLYQQQQLQQQGGAGGGNMLSNNNMGNMSNNNMNQMGQMGGGNQMGQQQNNMTPLMNQGMMNQNQGMNNQGVMLGSNGMNNNAPQDQLSNSQDRPSSSASGNLNGAAAGESKEDKAAWLKQLKDDIAKREKEAEALEASIGNDEKRKNDDGTPSSNKKAKLDTTAV